MGIELLERDPPPGETYAAEAYQLNLVLQRWLSRRDRQRRRELLATLQATPQQKLTAHYTLLRLLEAAPPSALNVYLPTRLRQAFYQNGIPIFGLKTSVRLLMALVIIGVGFVSREYGRPFIYSPLPLSEAHARTTLGLSPSIAKQPAANSCKACHSLQAGVDVTNMNANCAACHHTDLFIATVTEPHAAAGIGCTYCHTEHRGRDFRADLAPISVDFQPDIQAEQTCAGCHNNDNHELYNGRSVHTPHGGTFGYPVVNGEWKWKGLDQDELALKPEIAALRLPTDSESQWRSKQFHAMHLYRVLATGGVKGVAPAWSSAPVLSCSSCHSSMNPMDLESPRQTCAKCHNGYIDRQTQPQVLEMILF